MAKPSARQMKEFWDLVDRRLITSLHLQFLIDGRVDPHNVIVKVNYYDRSNYGYSHRSEHFWERDERARTAKLGFIVLVQDTTVKLAYEMLSYQAGHSPPDLVESESFFKRHPEMLEDGPIAALCGKPCMDDGGTIPGMVIIEVRKERRLSPPEWHFDSYVLKAGTRLLVTHIG